MQVDTITINPFVQMKRLKIITHIQAVRDASTK